MQRLLGQRFLNSFFANIQFNFHFSLYIAVTMAIKKSDTDKKLTGATSGYNKEEDTIDGRDLARKQT